MSAPVSVAPTAASRTCTDRMCEEDKALQDAPSSVVDTVSDTNMTRKRRRLTTPAEANHVCRVCGKLFRRSTHFKTHKETHDPSRVYAHKCSARGCGKSFAREPDLERHHQSVHMKQRNYQCELCGKLFARSDTSRR